jgi:hypothetical protein
MFNHMNNKVDVDCGFLDQVVGALLSPYGIQKVAVLEVVK